MAFYKIVSHSGGGFPLNVATSSVISEFTSRGMFTKTTQLVSLYNRSSKVARDILIASEYKRESR